MRDWNLWQIWLKCPKIRFLSLFSDFKSSYTDHVRFDYHYNLILTAAGLAPSVERLTAEREVAGSIPRTGPTLGVLKWLRNECIALDCKTVRIFAYSSTREQSIKRSGTRLKHALQACEARALHTLKTLTSRFTDFFTDFEKTTECFAVKYCLYPANGKTFAWLRWPRKMAVSSPVGDVKK